MVKRSARRRSLASDKNDWQEDRKNIALERCLSTRIVRRGSAVVVKRLERTPDSIRGIERFERLERVSLLFIPSVDGAAGAKETKDRISGGRKSRLLRP